MSDLYVRNLCATWADGVSVPYYNTINQEQEPTDDVWLTLDYQAINKQRDTYCSHVEVGIVSLIFFGIAGISYETLLAVAQDVVENEFLPNVDPTGRLTLELSQPPSDYTGLNSPSYVVEFAVSYTFR